MCEIKLFVFINLMGLKNMFNISNQETVNNSDFVDGDTVVESVLNYFVVALVEFQEFPSQKHQFDM